MYVYVCMYTHMCLLEKLAHILGCFVTICVPHQTLALIA